MSKRRKKTKKPEKGEKHARKPSMIKWVYLCCALAALIAIGALLSLPHSKAGPPKISLSETSFSFGATPHHSTVSHTFWIKNIGGDTLRIIKVKPG